MNKIKKFLAYPFVIVGLLFLVIGFMIHGEVKDKFSDWFHREVERF